MAPSRLEVPNHAQGRLKLRRITRQQLRECIETGALTGTDLKGRRIREKRIGKNILVVIYLEVMGGYLVITAYWKGLKDAL